MLGFEAIGNLIIKRAVSTLVKKSIDKFDTSGTPQSQVKLLISMLEDEIALETKKENQQESTKYTLDNLYNHYKLAQAYDRQQIFEDSLGFSKEKMVQAVQGIKARLESLEKTTDKATIYNFLADYYEDKDYKEFDTYNLLALEYSDSVAKIYKRHAQSEMLNGKYEDALVNVQSAIDIEPLNSEYLSLEVEILLHLNRLDNLLPQLERMAEEHKKEKNLLKLSDDYILMAKYYGKVQKEAEASVYFKKAYELIEKFDDETFAVKKMYLLSQIAIIDGDEDKIFENETLEEPLGQARESVRLMELQNLGLRYRLDFIEIADGLNEKGMFYYNGGKYNNAIYVFKKALKIRKKILGEEHPDTAQSYNNLAELYRNMGKYQKAEPLYLKALKIREKVLGEEHPDTASSYNNLAGLYKSIGDYQKAEPLYLKALEIREKVLGEEHPDTASSYNNLALLYDNMGEYQKAEPFYLKASEIWKKVLGEEHPSTATSYNNLAGLYESMGEYQKAEPLYLKALEIREKVLGEEHPDTATSYNNLAVFYYGQGDYERAYEFMKRAVEVRSKVLPSNHPDLIGSKKGLEMIEERRG